MRDKDGYSEKAYTVREVSEILNISMQTVRKMMKDGSISYFMVGRNYRIMQSALEKMINYSHGE